MIEMAVAWVDNGVAQGAEPIFSTLRIGIKTILLNGEVVHSRKSLVIPTERLTITTVDPADEIVGSKSPKILVA